MSFSDIIQRMYYYNPKRKEKRMKPNKKLTICAFTAALSIMSAVPVAVYADDSARFEWFTDESGRIFYYDTDGNYLTGVQEIEGKKYLFSANGVLKTGWRTIDGQRLYFDSETGKSVSGWIEYCDKKYYVDTENGKITGFFRENDNDAYILTEKGSAVTTEGFAEVGENTYYVNSDGKAQTGEVIIDDNTYFFADDGKMSTGFTEKDGNIYYFDSDGIMLKDWQVIDGNTYYFSGDGIMSTGKVTVEDNKYCFSGDGIMLTGWIEDGEQKYYCDSEGKMLSGWQNIDDKEYYFSEDGSLAYGLLTIADDGTYFLGDDGAKQTGWITVNSHQCYFNTESGKMVFGWQTIDGDEYFFNDYGIMETNTTIGGKTLGEDGKVQPLSAVQKRANEVIARIGTSTEAIFNFVVNNNRYTMMEATKTQAQIEAIGWSYFANYAFDNRFIVCYYYAAITDLLYKQAGYEARIVHGTGRGTGDHYWNEIKINGNWKSIDTCNGFYMVDFSYLQTQNYTFYNYVYPMYN